MALRKRRLGDRRARPRFEVVGQLWGALEIADPLELLDLGRGGALVASRVPLSPDSWHQLRFTFGGMAADVQARVRHVRTEGEGDGARYLIGLEFLSPPARVALEIDRLLGRGLPAAPPGGGA
jgi:hypothetical protein